jgi:hypothetical protein
MNTDTFFYSNSLCFGHSLHNSQVMEPFTCSEAMFSDTVLPSARQTALVWARRIGSPSGSATEPGH